jgi:hypothetical protein
MKAYSTLLALTCDERKAELVSSHNRAVVLTESKLECQKEVAKLIVAMIKSGECKSGEMREKCIEITGKDIKKTMQDVYGLVNVFEEIVDKTLEMTEEEFDKADSSKVALLSTFLATEVRDKLPAALEACKNGTAKEMRELKDKKPSKAEKEIESLKAKVAENEATEKARVEAEKARVEIPVGFVATDITPLEALVKSRQFRDRVRADMGTAIDAQDETTLSETLEFYGKVYFSACLSLGDDPLDFIAELAARHAAPAEAQVVETPAIECGEAVAA